jgi:hypothetical protein
MKVQSMETEEGIGLKLEIGRALEKDNEAGGEVKNPRWTLS